MMVLMAFSSYLDRKEHELIAPIKPTPYEIKTLSDLDNQKTSRCHVAGICIYRNVVGMEGRDPVKTIRDAIAQTLVYYYPLAGRVREGANHKLMVECTGEGVLFVEADAHVTLEEFGDVLKPPFPCMQDLLYNVPGSDGIVNCPLLLIQVTRLLCGGFIVALQLNHTMIDAFGFIQFMEAVAEMARGVNVPSIQPVWMRELISARDPPTVSCQHLFFQDLPDSQDALPVSQGASLEDETALIDRFFVFGSQEIAALKEHLPLNLRQCSRVEILTACVWRCYAICFEVNPNHHVRMVCAVNARSIYNPPLPIGYYGNAFGLPVAQTTAGKLCQGPLGYVLELIRKAKSDVTDEFMRSTTDLLVKRGQPYPTTERTYMVSDITHVGFRNIDFGWGKPTYGGPTGPMILGASFILPLKNHKGTDELAVTVNLPRNTMEKFASELDRLLKGSISTNSSSPMSCL